tara:strand:+ start:164 stop:556 length:393 start_codon:yes stop_codon:yes gene_type:complete
MKKNRVLSFLFILIISCSSNSDTYNSLSEEMLNIFKDVELNLEAIKDDLSAKQAVDSLGQLNRKMKVLFIKMEELKPIDINDQNLLKNSDYQRRLKEVLSNIFSLTVTLEGKIYKQELMNSLSNILNQGK